MVAGIRKNSAEPTVNAESSELLKDRVLIEAEPGMAALILWIVVGGYTKWAKSRVWRTTPQISGRLEQPLLGSPSLIITIWHHTPGDIKNGIILVSVPGSGNPGENDDSQLHRFETWSPNKDQAVTFTFPLPDYRADQEVPVDIVIKAKNLETFTLSDAWIGDHQSDRVLRPVSEAQRPLQRTARRTGGVHIGRLARCGAPTAARQAVAAAADHQSAFSGAIATGRHVGRPAPPQHSQAPDAEAPIAK